MAESMERIISGEDVISEISDMQIVMESAEQYYDSMGMQLSIAVMEPGVLVLSSKHWLKNCYIEVSRGVENVSLLFEEDKERVHAPRMTLELWDVLLCVSKKIDRILEHNENNDNYVFITHLNRSQTLKVYNTILEELKNRGLLYDMVEQYDLLGWDLKEEITVQIPWIKGFDWEKGTESL